MYEVGKLIENYGGEDSQLYKNSCTCYKASLKWILRVTDFYIKHFNAILYFNKISIFVKNKQIKQR